MSDSPTPEPKLNPQPKRRAAPRKAAAPRKSATKSTTVEVTRPISDLDAPQWYVHRELSWLEFNQRVLEEACDPENPPLERLKFLAIVSANLDEFFEIRVAGLQQQAETRPFDAGPDGLTASQALDAIAARVKRMSQAQYTCYQSEVVPALALGGLDLLTVDDLEERGRRWAKNYFEREVFPVLTPLAVDPAHPFPQLGNKSLNLVVELRVPDRVGELDGLLPDENHVEFRLGVVQVPRVLPRLVEIPAEFSPKGRKIYVFLSSLISAYVGQLFPGLEVRGCYAFRVTRNSELYLDEDEADNLLEAMQEQLARRRRGDAVRLEVQRGCDPAVVALLLRTFELDPIDLYEVDGPINLTRLMAIYGAEVRPDLKDAPFSPATPPQLKGASDADEFFAVLKREDILLHHPYDSFRSVTRFIELAASDPNVLAIKMTLYRTSKDSPIVKALMRAAESGKQVTALVELKARFDEENNIAWARAMEASGVHVVYGLVGLKTHSKLGFVVRREGQEIQRYVHLGTGNYNEVTARIYTDIGLLTSNAEIGEDASKVFNLLTGMSQFPGLKRLMMAPFGLDKEFIRRIERETANAKKAARQKVKTEARIIIKMNSLVDVGVIKALYRASQAGVRVDLIIRGICCLRPGIPGLSENIRVRSIIGRFLEHSRIFYFHNGGNEEILCGSADWMPRNFFRRVEIIYPILDGALRERIKSEILLPALADNIKAREILPDGTHKSVERAPNEAKFGFQASLLARQKQNSAPPRQSAPGALQLTPRVAPQILGAAIDGLPGTGADPVLQSLQQSLLKQVLNVLIPTNNSMESQDLNGEIGGETVKSDEQNAPETAKNE
ncbi:polyphosphate kinase [Abditibacterium utsteinense]|uniref:Polyphosphate kinase n=1 Tax=Abditibacterium utsteinense TaxID=1960156 RepID=A0A2S8SRI7_9BACT|nr:polyphosphate kinase 1 [Abditibacterium utsteinense]PQV63395.1 polyphosphate kinase [Abditibacterium utsteinense]